MRFIEAHMLIVDQTSSIGTWHYKLILSDTATDSQRQQFYDLALYKEVEAVGKLNEQLYLQMGDGAENYYGLKQVDESAVELMPYGGRITSGRMPENENEIIISNCDSSIAISTLVFVVNRCNLRFGMCILILFALLLMIIIECRPW
jgi:hypothetical protein